MVKTLMTHSSVEELRRLRIPLTQRYRDTGPDQEKESASRRHSGEGTVNRLLQAFERA
jgi:hypothetical protein